MENKKLRELLEAVKAKRKAKAHTPVVANKEVEAGKKAEELKAPIVEAVKPVHKPGEKPAEHKPEVKNADVIKGQHAETLKAPVIESVEPVHNPGEKPAEHTPEVKEKEVHAGEQKAHEVKAPIVEDNHEEIPEEKKEELADKGELDYEGDMALSQLRVVIDAAVELNDMLEGNKDANLPEWVQSKLTLAKEYIDTVRDYMKSEKKEAEEESFTKEEIMEVMEALNLDTHKYTFEYLAEQLGFVRESELGSAAAEPVHTEEKPVEHTPEVKNDDVLKGQHAEEVKEVIVEAVKAKKSLKVKVTPKKNVIVDKKGQLAQDKPSVTPAEAVVSKEGK